MLFISNKYHRRSIRLKDYDYSQSGLYFITICVQGKVCLFGKVAKSEIESDHEGRPYGGEESSKRMILNDAGEMVKREWLKIPNRFPNVHLHEFVVMPNHFHCILEIGTNICGNVPVGATLVVAHDETLSEDEIMGNDGEINGNDGATTRVARTAAAPKIGEIIAAFKSIVTVEYISGVRHLGWKPFDRKLWQRNYWEHIIRNYDSYQNIDNYIKNNPDNWHTDSLNI